MCLVSQLNPTLCSPLGCSLLVSSVRSIFQARIFEFSKQGYQNFLSRNTGAVAISSSKGSSNSGIEISSLPSPALAGIFYITSATWEALSLQHSYMTCSSVHYLYHVVHYIPNAYLSYNWKFAPFDYLHTVSAFHLW